MTSTTGGSVSILRRLRLLAVALAATATGCAAPKIHPRIDDHLIQLDPEGAILDRNGDPERDPKGRVTAVLDAMQRWLELPGKPARVLIHVHGGLTSPEATAERASRLIEAIMNAPGKDAAYPIFVSWPSGGFQSWWEGTWKLRNGRHERVIGPLFSPVYFATDLVQGAARAPIDMVYMLKNDVEAASMVAFDHPLSREWTNPEEIVAAMEADPQRRDRISIGPFHRGGLNQVGRSAAWIATLLPKLVLAPLALDGLGNTAWRTMRHRAYNSGRPSEEFDARPREPTAEEADRRLEPTPTGGLALLMGELARRISEARDPESSPDVEKAALQRSRLSKRFDLTLVGHSMGAILLNYVLELQPELPASDVVYMAPACTVADAARALVPYLARSEKRAASKPTDFWLLTLHPMAEAGEMYPEYLDLLPRGSLLEWVDDWYTSASHPLDRMFGKWNNAVPALHLFETVRERVHFKAFGVDDDSLPQRHGDFNDCPFWERDFWQPEGAKWVAPPE